MSSEIHDVESLKQAIADGLRAKYLFFWGHNPRHDGTIDKNCLSQWWHAWFELDGIRYPTAEHYMMAEKARLFGDEDTRRNIIEVEQPGAAKALGREVQGFDEDVWQAHRTDIVIRGNHAKFSQNPSLHEFLINTAQRILVEASPVDRIWGIGLAHDDERAADPHQWLGPNLLGFALMEVRRMLVG